MLVEIIKAESLSKVNKRNLLYTYLFAKKTTTSYKLVRKHIIAKNLLQKWKELAIEKIVNEFKLLESKIKYNIKHSILSYSNKDVKLPLYGKNGKLICKNKDMFSRALVDISMKGITNNNLNLLDRLINFDFYNSKHDFINYVVYKSLTTDFKLVDIDYEKLVVELNKVKNEHAILNYYYHEGTKF